MVEELSRRSAAKHQRVEDDVILLSRPFGLAAAVQVVSVTAVVRLALLADMPVT